MPLPATGLLMFGGLAALGAMRRRKKASRRRQKSRARAAVGPSFAFSPATGGARVVIPLATRARDRYPAAMCRALLPLLALSALLAACATPPAPAPVPKPAAQSNPAADFCTRSGGQVIPKQTASGTEGWCQLPSGLMVEEWAFFNQAHPSPGAGNP